MGIMSFHRSRFSRAVAVVTLASFLAGCLPQDVKSSSDSLLQGAGSITSGAGGLLASLSEHTSTLTEWTGVEVPGAKKGMENRSWSDSDQAGAVEALAVFQGKPLDNLPVYDPLRPGEAQKYKAKIAQLSAKYKGRTTLTADEMRELSEVVVPVARYLVKSRTYRESAKKAATITRDPKGQASVVVPAGMTLEVALLTYCNDHGLPAPWRGEKLQLRSSQPYMPEPLRELYHDLHQYASTHPAAHYQMQSLVWWLRDNSCNTDSMSNTHQQLIEAAHPGGMQVLQGYCSQQKLKKQVASQLMNRLPGAGAGAQLAQYKQMLNSAMDYQSKAQAFLSADLSNPQDLLQLAQSSGLTNSLGANTLLSNPALAKYAPLLKQAGMAKALIPGSTDDKAVATSLSVMEELGRQLGDQQGNDRGSLANYTKVADGLYVEATTNGGASNAFIKIRNTGTSDAELVGSNYVLTSVDDRARGHDSYRPTQRLSIGPMQPVAVGPNEGDARTRYTEQHERDAIDSLKQLKDVEAVLESGQDAKVEQQCAEREKANPGSGTLRMGDYKLGIIRDVALAVPVLGNVLYAYSALSGKDWITGAELSIQDRAVALVSAAIPAAAAIRGARVAMAAGRSIAGSWDKWKVVGSAYNSGSAMAYHAAAGIKGSEAVFSYRGNDGCTAWSAGASAVANNLCGRSGSVACLAYTGIASAAGNLPQVRKDTEQEVIGDFSARLEYALSPGGSPGLGNRPAIVKDAMQWLKSF